MRAYASSKSPHGLDWSCSKNSDLARPKDFGAHRSITTVVSRAATPGVTAPTAGDLLYFQRTVGNRRLGELLRGSTTTAFTTDQAVQAGIADPGRALDQPVRAEMESRLGHDFSRVRIHADAHADTSAHALHARAYTVGQDVVFAAGQYAPHNEAGRRLLAHELAHTTQQGSVSIATREGLHVSAPGDAFEHEANLAARSPFTSPSSLTQVGPRVQRQTAETEFEVEVPSPQELERLRKRGIDLPKVVETHTGDPRMHGDYIDRRLTAIGFGIYLGGYVLYCSGLDTPVFLPHEYVDESLRNAASINSSIYPSFDAAVSDIPYGPYAPGQPVPYAYCRAAGGSLIVPTVFAPATTPRIVEAALAVRRQLAEEVQQQMTVTALSLIGGAVLRAVISRVLRIGGGASPVKSQSESTTTTAPPRPGTTTTTAPPRPGTTTTTAPPRPGTTTTTAPPRPGTTTTTTEPIPAVTARQLARMASSQGRVIVNIGGAGARHEPQGAINVNPQVPGTERKDIPNLVKAKGEQIGDLFDPGTVDEVVGYRLPPIINWAEVAPGAFKVLKPGGRFEVSFQGAHANAAKVCADVLRAAGFQDVEVISGTMIRARKP
jgi:hypothetical protein